MAFVLSFSRFPKLRKLYEARLVTVLPFINFVFGPVGLFISMELSGVTQI